MVFAWQKLSNFIPAAIPGGFLPYHRHIYHRAILQTAALTQEAV
jgi:hypothetical protein